MPDPTTYFKWVLWIAIHTEKNTKLPDCVIVIDYYKHWHEYKPGHEPDLNALMNRVDFCSRIDIDIHI